jgi:5-formyltetrahydrofolate cyclo-ligase
LQQRFGKICVLTTVHDLQIVKEVPCEEHDTKVDLIVTPSKVIEVKCLQN